MWSLSSVTFLTPSLDGLLLINLAYSVWLSMNFLLRGQSSPYSEGTVPLCVTWALPAGLPAPKR